MIVQEQGSKGTSSLISGTVSGYKGYYNFFNVNAYETPSHNKITNGLIYAKNHGWNSVYNSIKGGADFYYRDYVSKKQNTYYLKKFNVNNGLSSVATHQYMTNVQGAAEKGLWFAKPSAAIQVQRLLSKFQYIIPCLLRSVRCRKQAAGSKGWKQQKEGIL